MKYKLVTIDITETLSKRVIQNQETMLCNWVTTDEKLLKVLEGKAFNTWKLTGLLSAPAFRLIYDDILKRFAEAPEYTANELKTLIMLDALD